MPRVTRPAAPPPSPWDLDRCSAAQLGQRWADLQAFASWLEAQGIKVPASWHTHGWVALQAWKARAYATDTHPGRPPTGPSAWPRSCATGSPSSPPRASTPHRDVPWDDPVRVPEFAEFVKAQVAARA